MCEHFGYPLIPLPGANIFLTAQDESTPDGAIRCKRITEIEALRLAGDGARLLSRLAELL